MLFSEFQLNTLRDPVSKGETISEEWRLTQLNRFKKLIDNHEEEVLTALNEDLGKPRTEAYFELIALRQELNLAINKIKEWIRPIGIRVPISLQPAKASVYSQPLGCILIIGPWNYPFSLTLQPLISALAAGNSAVLKPSEHSPNTSKLINKLISKYFPAEIVTVFEGDSLIAKKLLEKPFDHIFFTGGGEIGKEIMKAAAKNLTPVTLELGGKSPAIVIKGADIEVTAKRLIWGKFLNAGQTCIAPDYLLVEERMISPLIHEMKKSIIDFYGDNPLLSIDLGKIVNNYHFNRLTNLIDMARNKNQIFFGGETSESKCKISPTLAMQNSWEDTLMKEEIFGPILPIITIENLDNAISKIRNRPNPLAIYMFGGTQKDQENLISKTYSGGICFNDVVMQAGVPDLPFGGIGASGMGKYHGKSGFDTFSHYKSILKKPFWLDIKFRYPPYKLDISFLKNILS